MMGEPSENTADTAVYQRRAAKRKHFWTTQPCRPERYTNRDQQIEGPSGRHSRVDQSGISTLISKAKAHLPQRYINSGQQSKPPQAQQQSGSTAGTVYQQ